MKVRGVNLFDTCARTETSSFTVPWLVSTKPESLCNSDRHSPTGLADVNSIENPFLFPHDLLDATSGRCSKGFSGVDHRFQDQGIGDDCPRWWLVHTKPRQEKTLARELRAFNVPHYLPVTKCKALTRG